MKKYFSQVLIIGMLCICGLSVLEILTRRCFDAVKYKYEWIKKNASVLETLVLGPSTMYFDVNPESFRTVSFNAAFSMQRPRFDWVMFNADTLSMTNLKNVVLDITSEYENGTGNAEDETPYKLYCRCRDLPVNRYSLETGNPYRCRNKIERELRLSKAQKCDENGWIFHTSGHDEKWLRNNSISVSQSRLKSYLSPGGESVDYPGLLMDYCKRHNVRVILVRPPVYAHYKELVEKRMNFSDRIDSLACKYCERFGNVEYRDYSSDGRFSTADFYDAIHLNKEGADKWSEMLKNDFNL